MNGFFARSFHVPKEKRGKSVENSFSAPLLGYGFVICVELKPTLCICAIRNPKVLLLSKKNEKKIFRFKMFPDDQKSAHFIRRPSIRLSIPLTLVVFHCCYSLKWFPRTVFLVKVNEWERWSRGENKIVTERKVNIRGKHAMNVYCYFSPLISATEGAAELPSSSLPSKEKSLSRRRSIKHSENNAQESLALVFAAWRV